MVNDLTHLQAVTDALVARGYNATLEYPGFIEVLAHGLRFDFGTENDFWDGDVEADHTSGVVHTSMWSGSTDVEAIADALAVAIESCKPEEEPQEHCRYCGGKVDRYEEYLEHFTDGTLLHPHCADELRAEGQLKPKEDQ